VWEVIAVAIAAIVAVVAVAVSSFLYMSRMATAIAQRAMDHMTAGGDPMAAVRLMEMEESRHERAVREVTEKAWQPETVDVG
jgi:hypothetical protein